MARSGFDTIKTTDEGDSNAQPTAEDARQGENIKGMIWVLFVGVALIVVAYIVMLALLTDPTMPTAESAAVSPNASTQETAQSP